MTDTPGARGDELRPPWSPTGIALVTLLLSPIPGGILHALNYERLGVPARKRLALFSNLIAGVALFVVPSTGSAIFLPRSGVALLFAAYFYKSQERLFQAHLSLGGRKASLLLPVCLTILTVVILVAFFFAAGLLMR